MRECQDVRGLTIGGKETKISLYADDRTLIFKADIETVRKTLDIFHWFKKVSGLAINMEKTKNIKIGMDRAKRLIMKGQFGLEWSTTFMSLGIHFDVDRM